MLISLTLVKMNFIKLAVLSIHLFFILLPEKKNHTNQGDLKQITNKNNQAKSYFIPYYWKVAYNILKHAGLSDIFRRRMLFMNTPIQLNGKSSICFEGRNSLCKCQFVFIC